MSALQSLRRLLGIAPSQDFDDDLLETLLQQAADCILNVCNLAELPEKLEGAKVRLAVCFYNRLGAEGEGARSVGSISQTFLQEMPADVRLQLEPYVQAEVMGGV